MKVLVIGASGLVGGTILQRWSARHEFTVTGTSFRQPTPGLTPLDIRDGEAVARLLEREAPAVVALPAANSFVDYCELHPAETRITNVEGARNVIQACKRQGAALVYFSSDYVFSGEDEPYAEDAPLAPINEYGRQKAEVEAAMQAALADFLIVRLSGVFGWEARMKNLVGQIIQALELGRSMRLAVDQVYNPTYAVNMTDALGELLLRGERGIFHLVGADRTTRFDFGRAVAEAFGLDGSLLIPARLSELGSATPRPLRTGLLNAKACRRSGVRPWGTRESLRHMQGHRPRVGGTASPGRRADG